ncbi:MAG: nucleotidyltransferase domain-containing protein [Candidatus Omnitrophica bacterium]|nr:nucleotidyltransferase domain-containing protein [Candidatus Omnitrophota bacterium]
MVKDKRVRKIISGLTEKIKNDYKPEKVILYGSFAYGHPDKDSDIDLLIIKKTDERPIDRRVRVRQIVDIREPIAFSPFVITPQEVKYCLDRGDQFIKEIMNKGEVLYAK